MIRWTLRVVRLMWLRFVEWMKVNPPNPLVWHAPKDWRKENRSEPQ